MAKISVQDMIDAGVHFGHRASHWNPKMRPYVFGRRKLIHIIDVRETVRGILRAKKYLKQVAAAGGTILFVGTKRAASETIEQQGKRSGMPYVAERWLGGTLTNFRTIRSRLSRLHELESIMAANGSKPTRRKCSRRLPASISVCSAISTGYAKWTASPTA